MHVFDVTGRRRHMSRPALEQAGDTVLKHDHQNIISLNLCQLIKLITTSDRVIKPGDDLLGK